MKNWKVILQSNAFFFLFLFLAVCAIFFHFLVPKKSEYSSEETFFSGHIIDYSIDGDSFSFTMKGRENLKVFYTLKSEEEKEFFYNIIGYGSKVEVSGVLELPKENTIPNTFNYKEYLYYNHIFYIVKASWVDVSSVNSFFYLCKNKIRNYLSTLSLIHI